MQHPGDTALDVDFGKVQLAGNIVITPALAD
jgi:hypothetical protein